MGFWKPRNFRNWNYRNFKKPRELQELQEITDKKKKLVLLLYQADPKIREIFRQIPENGHDDDFDKRTLRTTKTCLYDVYQFRQVKLGNAETLDQYYTRLRTLSNRSDFADADFEIMAQIVL